MNTKEIKAMVAALAPVIKEFVESATAPLLKRIDELEKAAAPAGISLEEVRKEIDRGVEPVAKAVDAAREMVDRQTADIEGRFRDALSAIPIPKDGRDGTSVTPADVASMIADEVAIAVRRLPPPANGKDGRDGETPSEERIAAAVARHLEANPPAAGRDGIDGTPGRDGADGKDAAPITDAALDHAVARYLAAHPPAAGRDGRDGVDGSPGKDGTDGAPGRDGVDGKDAAPISAEDIDLAVTRHLQANPPAAGRDGRDGVDGAPGRDGIDGKDGAPGKAGADGRDGVGLAGALVDRVGQLVVTLTDGSTRELGPVIGRDGRDGANGRDGAPGRDGFSLKDFDAELNPDRRTLVLKFADGSDIAFAVELSFPVMIYRGVFKEGQPYECGDTVTWAGSLWHCDAATSERPGEGSKAWTLAAKRGRDGKEAVSIPRDRNAPVKL